MKVARLMFTCVIDPSAARLNRLDFALALSLPLAHSLDYLVRIDHVEPSCSPTLYSIPRNHRISTSYLDASRTSRPNYVSIV